MDTGAALAEISKSFGVTCWRGPYTRSLWALVPCADGWRLVEAVSPRELVMAITHPDGWPWPRRRAAQDYEGAVGPDAARSLLLPNGRLERRRGSG